MPDTISDEVLPVRCYLGVRTLYHENGSADIDSGIFVNGPLDVGVDGWAAVVPALTSEDFNGVAPWPFGYTLEISQIAHLMPVIWTVTVRETDMTTHAETTFTHSLELLGTNAVPWLASWVFQAPLGKQWDVIDTSVFRAPA